MNQERRGLRVLRGLVAGITSIRLLLTSRAMRLMHMDCLPFGGSSSDQSI
jgi:hypothetical protein